MPAAPSLLPASEGQSSPTGSDCFGNLPEHLCPIRPHISTQQSSGPQPSISSSKEPWHRLHFRVCSPKGVASGEQPGWALCWSLPVTSCTTKPQGLRWSLKLQSLESQNHKAANFSNYEPGKQFLVLCEEGKSQGFACCVGRNLRAIC